MPKKEMGDTEDHKGNMVYNQLGKMRRDLKLKLTWPSTENKTQVNLLIF